MSTLLKVVGGIWAALGVANIVLYDHWQTAGDSAIGVLVIFNMLAFVLPGLVVAGIGSAISNKQSGQPPAQPSQAAPGGMGSKTCSHCQSRIKVDCLDCPVCGHQTT